MTLSPNHFDGHHGLVTHHASPGDVAVHFLQNRQEGEGWLTMLQARGTRSQTVKSFSGCPVFASARFNSNVEHAPEGCAMPVVMPAGVHAEDFTRFGLE